MKVIETLSKECLTASSVWIEHRLWRWLRPSLYRSWDWYVKFELSTAYEGDWDLARAIVSSRWSVWIEHRLWRWLRLGLELDDYSSSSVWIEHRLWRWLRHSCSSTIGVDLSVWIEHRLWRWLRHSRSKLFNYSERFELSTAYEGDWDIPAPCAILEGSCLNWAPLMKVIETYDHLWQ